MPTRWSARSAAARRCCRARSTPGRTGAAAELVGVGAASMDMTVDYLKQRKQFGRLIGEFQALQFRAAHLYSELEIARAATLKAQQLLDEGSAEAEAMVSVAKAKAGRASQLAVQEGVQMHGGIGMTDEYDIGLYMKRDRVLNELFGDPGLSCRQAGADEGLLTIAATLPLDGRAERETVAFARSRALTSPEPRLCAGPRARFRRRDHLRPAAADDDGDVGRSASQPIRRGCSLFLGVNFLDPRRPVALRRLRADRRRWPRTCSTRSPPAASASSRAAASSPCSAIVDPGDAARRDRRQGRDPVRAVQLRRDDRAQAVRAAATRRRRTEPGGARPPAMAASSS